MELGVCYFPEHWPRNTWQPDAERMKRLGLSWVRVGEFAWSVLEPAPGELRFEWLDHALATLGGAGLKVVLCTPTATPPKWLVDRRPDILPTGADGHVRGFGSRRHYCFNSAAYRQETERIVTLLAERYGEHPAVRAWQLDNEYGCHDTARCYCRNCRTAFRRWLEARYGDIETLNEAWFNTFWSMRYQSFDEVELPNLTVTEPNPSHSLDFYRFASDAVIAYNRLQVEILRRHSPGRRLIHNSMGFFGDYDHAKLAADLDAIAWDSYPLGMLEQSPLPDEAKARYLRVGHPDLIAFNHDLYRGLKDRPFWVMEQQPGQVNWAPSNPLPAPGAVRLWSHQAFAHGAEVVSYFRWRAAEGAQELMHAGLNLHDGRPDRASAEAAQVTEELEDLPPERASLRHPEVALLFDYEDLWATQLQPHAQSWNYWALQLYHYSALRALGVDVDVIPADRDLTPYRLVIAPALHLVDQARAAHLEAFAALGGQLVLGPRSGFKTPSNRVQTPAPGPLAPLTGVRIDHVDALRPGQHGTVELAGESHRYHTWADLLTPVDAAVLAYYTTPAYRGQAAVTQREHGAGRVTVIGCWPGEQLLARLTVLLLEQAGVSWTALPEGVRISRLQGGETVLNFAPETVAVELAGEHIDLAPYEMVRRGRG